MTKKHFIELADAIRDHNKYAGIAQHAFSPSQIDILADFCRAQNPRFNYSRWIAYVNGECGPNGGAIKQAKVEVAS